MSRALPFRAIGRPLPSRYIVDGKAPSRPPSRPPYKSRGSTLSAADSAFVAALVEENDGLAKIGTTGPTELSKMSEITPPRRPTARRNNSMLLRALLRSYVLRPLEGGGEAATTPAAAEMTMRSPAKFTPRKPVDITAVRRPLAEGRLLGADYAVRAGQLVLTYDRGTFGGAPVRMGVSTLWLRDACTCSACVTPSSGQKTFATHELPAVPAVRTVGIEEGTGGHRLLRVVWEDGGEGHVSIYNARELLFRQASYGAPLVPVLPGRRLWDRRTVQAALRPVAYADWMAPDDGRNREFYRALTDLHQLGLLVVDGVPDDDEGAVRRIANQIGNIQTTFYGELFDVVSKAKAENVAYTNVFLGLHQDLLYMREPPHIQLLHCLRNDAAGGESLFSDSVRAAIEMQLHHRAEATALARLSVRYHYERNGHFYYYARPVINVAGHTASGAVSYGPAADHVICTSWSPPFQDTFGPVSDYVGGRLPALDPSDSDAAAAAFGSFGVGADAARLTAWHAAARRFSGLLEHPDNLLEFKLQPGQCVLFDNRRVLHGRRQFTVNGNAAGSRWLKGAYIDEQTFNSRVIDMVRRGLYRPPEADAGGSGGARLRRMPLTPSEMHINERMQVQHMLAQKAALAGETPATEELPPSQES